MSPTPLRMVIVILGIVELICVLGFVVLAFQGTPVPDELKITSASTLTGLLGILAPTRTLDQSAGK